MGSVEKALLGAIVITRYNNTTYRIDEIAWDKHPSDEFEGRNNEKISYMKYYADKPSPEAHLQVDASVLQLAWYCESPRPLPVCPQIGFLSWRELAQGAQRAAGTSSVLPVNWFDCSAMGY